MYKYAFCRFARMQLKSYIQSFHANNNKFILLVPFLRKLPQIKVYDKAYKNFINRDLHASKGMKAFMQMTA